MIAPGWLRAGAVLAAVGVGWTAQGWRLQRELADLRSAEARSRQAAAEARSEQIRRVLASERAARDAIDNLTRDLAQEKERLQHEQDTYRAGLRSGAIRMSVPIAPAAVRPGAERAATCPAAGAGEQARADLAPAAAEFLDELAGEGDDAIRQLNAVIDAYQAARESLHVQAPEPAQLPAAGQ